CQKEGGVMRFFGTDIINNKCNVHRLYQVKNRLVLVQRPESFQGFFFDQVPGFEGRRFEDVPGNQFVDNGDVILPDLADQQPLDVAAFFDVLEQVDKSFQINHVFC